MANLSTNIKENIILIKKTSNLVYPESQILANLATTQAILESAILSKPSLLAKNYNNLFGIKGKGTNGSVSLPTNEFIKGKWVKENQDFAWNLSLEDSFRQHKTLLNKPRYRPVINATSFNDAAIKIRLCGYATDPNYSIKLIQIYNNFLK